MARADLLTQMRSRRLSQEEFNFEMLTAPPLSALLSPTDIGDLRSLIMTIQYSSKPELKNKYQKEILGRRGFKWFHAGTNRNVFRFIEDQTFLLKVVHSRSGLQDNFLEYKNQHLIKPACTKVFDVSECGTVELVERVEPILSREQFISIAPYIFDLLESKLIGKYVLSDIGSKYFRNYGLRLGYGPVLLDFPYVYELDGDKLYCNHIDENTSIPCGGVIDYDDGFNELHCTKCGLLYRASDLAQYEEENKIIKGGKMKMKVAVYEGEKELWTSNKQTKKLEKSFIEPYKEKKASFKVAVKYSNGTEITVGNKSTRLKAEIGKEKIKKPVIITVENYDKKKVDKSNGERKEISKDKNRDFIENDKVNNHEDNPIYTDINDENVSKDTKDDETDSLGIAEGVAETIREYLKSDSEVAEEPIDTNDVVNEETTDESEDGYKPFNPDEHPDVVQTTQPVVNPTRPTRSARFDPNSDYWKTGNKK